MIIRKERVKEMIKYNYTYYMKQLNYKQFDK